MQGQFDFHNQFQPIASFFQYEQFYSVGLLSPAVIVAAIGTLWIARYRKDERLQKLTILFLVGAFVFFFMQTRLSVFLWEKIPFMPLFEFPWRMMGPFALMTSILAGFALASLFDGRSKLVITSTEIIFLCLCIMNAVPHLRNNKPLPEQIAVQLPRILDAKAIAQNGLSASVLDEYLPKAADPESGGYHRGRSGRWSAQSRQFKSRFSKTQARKSCSPPDLHPQRGSLSRDGFSRSGNATSTQCRTRWRKARSGPSTSPSLPASTALSSA